MKTNREYGWLFRDLVAIGRKYRELAEQFPDADREMLEILLQAELRWEAAMASTVCDPVRNSGDF